MDTVTKKHWHIAATLEQVDQICLEITDWLSAAALDEYLFSLQLLIREALNNAVIHGCAQTSAGEVDCAIELAGNLFCLQVSDSGPGFDWQATLRQEPDAGNLESGRGLRIYQLYADTVEFNSTGNQVRLTRRLPSTPTAPA